MYSGQINAVILNSLVFLKGYEFTKNDVRMFLIEIRKKIKKTPPMVDFQLFL